jgi:type IV fimbrial biogenesis protein FimT
MLLRAQPPAPSIAIAGATTDLSFTPPAGQVIGGFRSFVSARATAGSRRPRIRTGASGLPPGDARA